jgi:hypothetical protein
VGLTNSLACGRCLEAEESTYITERLYLTSDFVTWDTALWNNAIKKCLFKKDTMLHFKCRIVGDLNRGETNKLLMVMAHGLVKA